VCSEAAAGAGNEGSFSSHSMPALVNVVVNRRTHHLCWILMVTEFAAYFDDGGHPDNQDLVLVAGFLSSTEQWLKVETEWQNALESLGLPRSTVFRMTDFMAGTNPKSPSYGWDENKRHRLLNKLVHILAIRTLKRFSETVFMKDYREINEKYALEECYGAPYALAGRNLNMRLKKWLGEQGPDARLRIFFEDGTKHKGDLMDACRRDGLPCPSFPKKDELAPLQAADLLAWEIAKTMRKVRDYPDASADYYFDVLSRYNWQKEDDTAYTVKELEAICNGSAGLPVAPLRSEIGTNYYIAYETLKKKPRRRTIF
jgi:hypothetical protein